MFWLRVLPWRFWLIGGLLPFLFWAAVGIFALMIILALVKPSGNPPSNPALEILKERYAKGEITKEDYENMRRTLMA